MEQEVCATHQSHKSLLLKLRSFSCNNLTVFVAFQMSNIYNDTGSSLLRQMVCYAPDVNAFDCTCKICGLQPSMHSKCTGWCLNCDNRRRTAALHILDQGKVAHQRANQLVVQCQRQYVRFFMRCESLKPRLFDLNQYPNTMGQFFQTFPGMCHCVGMLIMRYYSPLDEVSKRHYLQTIMEV